MRVRHRRSVETRKEKLSVSQVYLELWCHLRAFLCASFDRQTPSHVP